MTTVIDIGSIQVGEGRPPFIIAEMSGNHNQSIDKALRIVDEAAATGCHALKIQTYTADTMTIDIHEGRFVIQEDDSLWKGNSLYKLYQQASTPWEWHEAIFDRCKKHGLIGFSTPFDETAVDFLENLDVPLYKIASFENAHIPLLRKVARTGKPIIMSTGMATIAELYEAVQAIRSEGNERIILLKCTSSYPASPKDSNIATIPHMRDLFDVPVGLSDHTLGVGAAVASVALGAAVIEKHFTLARSEGGPDAAFSMEPSEMKALVEECERAYQAIGSVSYGTSDAERKSLMFRRSIFAVRDVDPGELFTPDNVRIIRPGFGLAPKHLDRVLGRPASKRVARGTPLSWELIG